MKFITRVLAVLFVFAIPASASAWFYFEDKQGAINSESTNLYLAVICHERVLRVQLHLRADDDETRYPKKGRVDIITRFDQSPAFKVPWVSYGGEWNDSLQWESKFVRIDSEIPENLTHWKKFLNGLRDSNRVQLRPEQQSVVYTTSLIGAKSAIDRVLRDCGRDDLIE